MDSLLDEWDSVQNTPEKGDILPKGMKSSEEIQLFSLKEDMSDLDLTLTLLESSHIIQKTVGIQSIFRLFRQNHRPTIEKVFPRILKESTLLTLESSLQKSLAETIKSCIEANILSKQQLVDIILPPMMTMLQGRCDHDVTDAWVDAFVASIKFIPKEVLKEKVVDFVLSRSAQVNVTLSRVIACKIIGGLVPHIDPSTIEMLLLDKISMLCQDIDYEVRACMCEQLVPLVAAIGPTLAKENILNDLKELTGDEELVVRQAALQSIATLSNAFDKHTIRSEIIPYFKLQCQSPPDDLMVLTSKIFGDLLHRISNEFEDEDESMVFYNFFKYLAKRPDPECRRNCAYNFPAVVKCMNSRRYAMNLHDAYHLLSRDSDLNVRICIAAGFHEMASLLGKERSVKYLKEIFINLLKDESMEVRGIIVEHLEQILSMFAVANEEQKNSLFSELISHLVEFQNTISKSWRCLNSFITQLIDVPEYYTNDQVYDNFVPLMFKYMEESVAPIRESACKTICHYLRKNKRSYQRTNIIAQLIQKFGKRKSCYHRMVFVDVCQNAYQMFSRRFFKDNFFDAVMELSKDSVPNVRWKFCKILPLLKRTVFLLRDETAIKLVDHALEALVADKDRDVSELSKLIQAQMSQEMSTMKADLSSNDVVDKKKEEEEKAITAMESSESDEPRRKDEGSEGKKEHRRRYNEAECVSPILTMQPPKKTFMFSKPISKGAPPPPASALASNNPPPGRPAPPELSESKVPTTRISYPSPLRRIPLQSTTPPPGPVNSFTSPPQTPVQTPPGPSQSYSMIQSSPSQYAPSKFGKPTSAPSNNLFTRPTKELDLSVPRGPPKQPMPRKSETPTRLSSSLTGPLPSVSAGASRNPFSKPASAKGERASLDSFKPDMLATKPDRMMNGYLSGAGSGASSGLSGSGSVAVGSAGFSLSRSRRY